VVGGALGPRQHQAGGYVDNAVASSIWIRCGPSVRDGFAGTVFAVPNQIILFTPDTPIKGKPGIAEKPSNQRDPLAPATAIGKKYRNAPV
jgi:hypothetical protein